MSFSRALLTPVSEGGLLKKSYLRGSLLQEQDFFEKSR